MIDGLKDLLFHTVGMDFDIIKVTADDDGKTTVNGITEDKKLIMYGSFNKAIPEFTGVFGLTKLDTINKIVRMYDRSDDAIEVQKTLRNVRSVSVDDSGNEIMDDNGNPVTESVEAEVVDAITFKRTKPRMKTNHRVVSSALLPKQFRVTQNIDWDVVVQPTLANIDVLKAQAGLGLSETFKFEVEDTGDGKQRLMVVFGDTERDSEVEFINDITVDGEWTGQHGWRWNINTALSVFQFAKTGEMTIKLSSKGLINVTVDTGMSEYNYLMPALTA